MSSAHAPVEVVMALTHPDGSGWRIPVRTSLIETKRALNAGYAMVTLDVVSGSPVAVNPAHVAAVRFSPSETEAAR